MVSIITPTYNSSSFIIDTYHSILSQTISDWEWIVTDDCSTDSTWHLLWDFAKNDPRIKIMKNEFNSGAAVTRNKCLSRASGDFLAFIDSDDIWLSEKIEKQLQYMEKNKINFSFTAYELINTNGASLKKFIDIKNTGAFSYSDMLRKKATLGCSTVMLRKKAFSDLTMPLIRTGQDYAFWLKLLKNGETAYLLNEPLTKYRIVSNSISRNKFRKAMRQWQIYRKIEKLNLAEALECFFFYAVHAVFR